MTSILKSPTAARILPLMLLAAVAILFFACAAPEEPVAEPLLPPPAQIEIPHAVSVNAVMVAVIDHSAHFIWDVAREGNAPETDADWLKIELHATQLAAGGTLIGLGGTGQADAGWAKLPDWRKFAKELSTDGLLGIEAARDRHYEKVLAVGDLLIENCEACHQMFKPDLPTEGIVHPH